MPPLPKICTMCGGPRIVVPVLIDSRVSPRTRRRYSVTGYMPGRVCNCRGEDGLRCECCKMYLSADADPVYLVLPKYGAYYVHRTCVEGIITAADYRVVRRRTMRPLVIPGRKLARPAASPVQKEVPF